MHSHVSCVQHFATIMDCRLPGSPTNGVLQARIVKWVAIPSSKGSCWYSDWTHISFIAGEFFTTEPPGKTLFLSLHRITQCHNPRTVPGNERTRKWAFWLLSSLLPLFMYLFSYNVLNSTQIQKAKSYNDIICFYFIYPFVSSFKPNFGTKIWWNFFSKFIYFLIER